MGFLDLFRPKWRHSDPTVRADAVRDLSDDEMNAIERVLKEDPDAAIRRIALRVGAPARAAVSYPAG